MDKIAIIGDIHGCHQTLLTLLDKIDEYGDVNKIYTVGDLIDRGPSSKHVVQEVIDRKIQPVMGNHEDMFMNFMNDVDGYTFFMNGGQKTIESYGDREDIPQEHIDFLSNLPYFIETEDFILSHAGVSTMIKKSGHNWRGGDFMAKQELLWNRDNTATMEKLQIFGHTPKDEVHKINRNGETIAVNLDTGCVLGYSLSALILPTLDIIQVKKSDEDSR